jgi:triosephosphate isomerase
VELSRKRVPVVAANWKMNKTCAETVSYLSRLVHALEEISNEVEVLIFPPFTALRTATTYLESEKKFTCFPKIGAQNMHWEQKGAFTGEVSPLMLAELGIKHVILGHSERRLLFAESEEMILMKVRAAIQHGFIPIICVGETLEQREEGKTEAILTKQLEGILEYLQGVENPNFILAYEPVWAIGTGVAAGPEQANDACRFIRALVGSYLSPEIASKIRILYGGSVSTENFRDFLLEPDIDGGLIGTASLDVDKFVQLVRMAVDYA